MIGFQVHVGLRKGITVLGISMAFFQLSFFIDDGFFLEPLFVGDVTLLILVIVVGEAGSRVCARTTVGERAVGSGHTLRHGT